MGVSLVSLVGHVEFTQNPLCAVGFEDETAGVRSLASYEKFLLQWQVDA